MDDHDSSYKHLFAHTRMAHDLFTGFLSGQGLPDLALASLEKINASHVTDDLRSKNTAAMLFALENSRTPADLQRLTDVLVDWLQAPEHASLRRAFSEWIVRVLVPNRFPGVHIPALLDLQEVTNMLKETVKEWTQEGLLQEGLLAGLQAGLQAGREEGLQTGRMKGHRESTLDLLTRDFGPLPESVQQRIETASIDEMKRWTSRLFEARTLDDIFR